MLHQLCSIKGLFLEEFNFLVKASLLSITGQIINYQFDLFYGCCFFLKLISFMVKNIKGKFTIRIRIITSMLVW